MEVDHHGAPNAAHRAGTRSLRMVKSFVRMKLKRSRTTACSAQRVAFHVELRHGTLAALKSMMWAFWMPGGRIRQDGAAMALIWRYPLPSSPRWK